MVDFIRPPKKADSTLGKESAAKGTEPVFEPPEAVAARDEQATKSGGIKGHVEKIKGHATRGKHWYNRLNQTQKLAVIGALLIVLTALGLLGYKLTRPDAPYVPDPAKYEKPEPTTIASPLTGVQVDPELAKLPVTGIMIENSPDARPQSGLRDAGVVFEAVAEGGITRFLALYQEAKPKYVGPVRSARPYYVRWALGFDAGYAHVGGSPDAIRDIRRLGVRDLDQFYNPGSYDRVNSRFAPHNVYTSLDRLLSLQKSKGWTSSTFSGFERQEGKAVATPTASSISLTISGPLYNVSYSYDKKGNNYKRVMAGSPHKDEKSGKQIIPKVVIALITAQGIAGDGVHSTYKSVGSGQVLVFQNGTVTKGTWEKKSDSAPLKFKNSEGNPLKLNPGQTWITVVGSRGAVSYKP